MIYHPELFYFYDTKDFPLKKALLATAKAVSNYCYDYSSQLITPKKGAKEKTKQGILPRDKKKRERFIEDIFDWIAENSKCWDLFALFLYGKQHNTKPDETDKFDHHDDTCCWALNLTDVEFAAVQKEWQRNNLPQDLFYPRDSGIQKGWHCYTPKRWQAKSKKDKSPNEDLSH